MDCDQLKKLVLSEFRAYALGSFFGESQWKGFWNITQDFIEHCASESQQDLLDKFLWEAHPETISVACGGALSSDEQRQIAIGLDKRLQEILDAVGR